MRVLIAVFAIWLANPAAAETILVRSGEHSDFSRLVLKPAGKPKWVLGRSATGYELRLDDAAIGFDVTRVFDLIPRTRITGVTAEKAGAPLVLAVVEGMHAVAFTTGTGAIVIDVSTGPPPADSPFEAPIEKAVAKLGDKPAATEIGSPAKPAPEPLPTGGAAPAHPGVPPGGSVTATPGAVAFLPAPAPRTSYRPAIAPDPRLAIYWRTPAAADAPPGAAPLDPPATVAPLGLPSPIDPRVAEAEAHLLKQLGRAASQGLIEPASRAPPKPAPMPAHPEPALSPELPNGNTPTQSATETHAGDTAQARPDPVAHQSVKAVTSIDREIMAMAARSPVTTGSGDACLPDDAVAIGSWADDRPFPFQLADARGPIVGEFDRPTAAAVEKLARLYLHFGFGAEAVAALAAFGIAPADGHILHELALIIDAGHGTANGPFAGMADCDTAAALWAVLALPKLGPGDDVDHSAVLRTFSGLPLHLRRQLGPMLSNRFLGAGAPDAARAVRDAIARAPGNHGDTVNMIDAHLDLAAGDAKSAERLLDSVVADSGPMSPEAVILAVQSRLDRGAPVEPKLTETVAALEFEHRKSADGPDLARAHILARAAGGDFAEAFAALKRWTDSGPARLQSETTEELLSQLVLPEAEPVFLESYFSNRHLVDPARTTPELAMALADRLLEQGFAEEARRVLGPQAGETESGRLALARSALVDSDPATALRYIAGLTGSAATRIRGDALAQLGRHQDAALAYLAMEMPESAAPEAWRGGIWPQVATLGTEAQRAAVDQFGLAANDGVAASPADPDPFGTDGGPAGPGTLARGQALLDASRAARAALDALLAETQPVATLFPGPDG